MVNDEFVDDVKFPVVVAVVKDAFVDDAKFPVLVVVVDVVVGA